MNRKGFAAVVILLIVIIVGVIVFGVIYLYPKNQSAPSPQAASPITAPPSAEATSTTYINNLLGYRITLPSPWRVSEQISKEFYQQEKFANSVLIGSVCQNLVPTNPTTTFSFSTTTLQNCITQHIGNAALNQLVASIESSWQLENADTIFVTNLPLSWESSFVSDIHNLKTTLLNLPKDSYIIIRPALGHPTYPLPSHPSMTWLKLIDITLADGSKMQLMDERGNGSEFPGFILADIPHDSNYLIPVGDKTEDAGVLEIQTSANKGSDTEAEFLDLVRTITFH